MKKDEKIFLTHILESIGNIEEFTKDIEKKEFESKIIIQSASVRQLEIIGEAVKNLPKSFRDRHPDIEWKKISGLRDILIHGYFNVDLDLT